MRVSIWQSSFLMCNSYFCFTLKGVVKERACACQHTYQIAGTSCQSRGRTGTGRESTFNASFFLLFFLRGGIQMKYRLLLKKIGNGNLSTTTGRLSCSLRNWVRYALGNEWIKKDTGFKALKGCQKENRHRLSKRDSLFRRFISSKWFKVYNFGIRIKKVNLEQLEKTGSVTGMLC